MVLVSLQQIQFEFLRHGHRSEPHAQKGSLKVLAENDTRLRPLIDDAGFVPHQHHGLRSTVLNGSARGQRDELIPVGFVPVVVFVRNAVVELLRPRRDDLGLPHVAQKGEIELEGAVVVVVALVVHYATNRSCSIDAEVCLCCCFSHRLRDAQYRLYAVHSGHIDSYSYPEIHQGTHSVAVPIQVGSIDHTVSRQFDSLDADRIRVRRSCCQFSFLRKNRGHRCRRRRRGTGCRCHRFFHGSVNHDCSCGN
mmetsp:Transcript_23171/g.49339  ORF Transcript_23171/g.49339 Transcript_23171/m.49339 type:complete len:251 (-) Transcript_23171:112-864(-)